MTRPLLTGLLLALSALLPAHAADPAECRLDSLRFTMVPKKDIDRQIAEHQPLARLLGEGTGIPVRIVRATSYDSVIDAVVSGGVDLAVLGPASYITAYRRNAGIEPFASLEADKGHFTPAGSHYTALLLVRRDQNITTLEQARGARVALSDPASTSGALIPNTEFPDTTGLPLAQFFSAQVYTGSHDKSLDTLLAGRVDAAFVSSARADEYLRRGLITPDTLHVLWTSRPIHYDPFVFRAGLCDALKTRIRDLMMKPSPAREAFLHAQGVKAIAPVSHQDYAGLLRLMPAR